MNDLFDLSDTLEGSIVDLLLEKLSPKIEPWEAEEIAIEIIDILERRILG